jgi:hypothetical protein
MERLQEYKTHNAQFCKRMFDFLSIMFIAQVSVFSFRNMKLLVTDIPPNYSPKCCWVMLTALRRQKDEAYRL